MPTAEHPQTDSQVEATVKIIQKMLRPFVFQGQDWEGLLPTLEFAYNDTVQSSIGQTPFYLNYGYHPTGTTRHEPVIIHMLRMKYNIYYDYQRQHEML